MITCQVCGKKVPTEEVDEFEPEMLKKGTNIPEENIGEEVEEWHIFTLPQYENLFIHYSEEEA